MSMQKKMFQICCRIPIFDILEPPVSQANGGRVIASFSTEINKNVMTVLGVWTVKYWQAHHSGIKLKWCRLRKRSKSIFFPDGDTRVIDTNLEKATVEGKLFKQKIMIGRSK